ncbi:transposase [Bacillus thuringiensis]|nr:transposase [Bacillus thuringiensis]
MKERGEIEQQFSKLKNKRLKQPRWYDRNRYLLHVQLVLQVSHQFNMCILKRILTI